MILAIFSSLSLSIMIVIDKLMIKDCYEGNVKHALFVSSFFGLVFGIGSTIFYWVVSGGGVGVYFSILLHYLDPYGFLVMLAGVLSIQVLYHYFTCFSEDADSTVMASWFAAAPIFVYFASYSLQFFGIFFENIHFSWLMAVVVIVTAGSLSILERISYVDFGHVRKYRHHLFLMLFFNTVYVLLIDQTLGYAAEHVSISNHVFVLSMLPMYWLGFAAGMRFFIPAHERSSFIEKNSIQKFIIPILVVELFGMFVFFFEFLGLGQLDPVTVSIIVGLHVIPVWLLSVWLSRVGKSYVASGKTHGSFLGAPITSETLSDFMINQNTWRWQLFLVATTALGVSLFLLLSRL